MLKLAFAALAAALLFLTPTVAKADDWVAVKLRGTVMQFVGGEWITLERGDVVPDDRVIRTLQSGRVQFQRDAETIDLGPETQVQIIDQSAQKFTTVKQYFGVVTVEAEARNVQHFAVETPHLAAVVKGTIFEVASGDTGAEVSVRRGRVAVTDEHNQQSVTVVAGQTVVATVGKSLAVSGSGELPVPVNADGTPVGDVANDGSASDGSSGNSNNGNGNGGGNNGNNGNGGGNNGNGGGNNGNGGNGGGLVGDVVDTVGGILGGIL